MALRNQNRKIRKTVKKGVQPDVIPSRHMAVGQLDIARTSPTSSGPDPGTQMISKTIELILKTFIRETRKNARNAQKCTKTWLDRFGSFMRRANELYPNRRHLLRASQTYLSRVLKRTNSQPKTYDIRTHEEKCDMRRVLTWRSYIKYGSTCNNRPSYVQEGERSLRLVYSWLSLNSPWA